MNLFFVDMSAEINTQRDNVMAREKQNIYSNQKVSYCLFFPRYSENILSKTHGQITISGNAKLSYRRVNYNY